MSKTFSVLLAGVFVLALCGCDEAFQPRTTRNVSRAEKKEREGDYGAAVQLYEAALDSTPKSADVHYQLGLLFDGKMKDPLSATYHFQRYLAIAPRGAHAKDARRFIEEDELKIVSSLSKGAMMTQQDAARLKNENLRLQKEADAFRAQRAVTPTSGARPPRGTPPPGARTYTVRAGDTLASISRQFYKTSARTRDIQDANYNLLGGTTKLKPGMTLLIPGK